MRHFQMDTQNRTVFMTLRFETHILVSVEVRDGCKSRTLIHLYPCLHVSVSSVG